jgi:hypothetical protein
MSLGIGIVEVQALVGLEKSFFKSSPSWIVNSAIDFDYLTNSLGYMVTITLILAWSAPRNPSPGEKPLGTETDKNSQIDPVNSEKSTSANDMELFK